MTKTEQHRANERADMYVAAKLRELHRTGTLPTDEGAPDEVPERFKGKSCAEIYDTLTKEQSE